MNRPTPKHGELTHPGDEYNRDDFYYCVLCRSSHTRSYSGCGGLRFGKPRIRGSNSRYVCFGSAVPFQETSKLYGIGATPLNAYVNWLKWCENYRVHNIWIDRRRSV